MAYAIQPHCTACGDCLTACPNQAIRASFDDSPALRIDPILCTECVGYSAEPQCASVCPENAIEELDPAQFLAYWDAHRYGAEPLARE